MRGSSHLAANAGLTVTVSTPPALPLRKRSSPTAKRSNPARISGKACSATSVVTSRARPLVLRTNSGLPSQSSSVRTNWPTAAGVTFSSCAAREKLWCLALASKARKALR